METEDDRMLWIDIETTGLDPVEDAILEVGLVLTDWKSSILSNFTVLIKEPTHFYLDAIKRGKEHNIIGPMHEKSLLWDDLSRVKHASRKGAENQIGNWLTSNNVRFGSLPMCGSSIGSLDRPMLHHQMPMLLSYFHYRSIDVSSIKESCRRLNPNVFEAFKKMEDESDEKVHRVLNDITQSIREYRFYCDEFLIVGRDD